MRDNPLHRNYPGREKKLLIPNYSSSLIMAYLDRKTAYSKQKNTKKQPTSNSSGQKRNEWHTDPLYVF